MRTIVFFIGLSLLFFFVIPIHTNAQSIEGCVTNGLTGDLLENAMIDCGPWTSITGSDGCFGFFLDPGTYNLTCVYGDLCPFDTTITLINNQAIQLDIQLYPCSELIVEPLNIDVTLEPNAQTTEIITISNPNEISVEWSAELEIFPPGNSDELFDLIFQTPLSGVMETGAETNGTYIYTTSPFDGTIYRYDMSGLFLNSFSLGSGFYDLAFDGLHFYGSNGTTLITEMDLDLEVFISSFTVPQSVKAIAFDSDEGVFYGYGWGGDVIVFDQSGAMINSFPVGPNDPVYSSFAYDNVTSGAPYLWGNGLVDGDPNVLIQIALPDFQFTGITANLNEILPEPISNGAGGLFVSPDIVPGIFAIAGIVQDEWMWALELEETSQCQWVSIEPISGTLEPGESEEMSVSLYATTDQIPWTYEAEIGFTTIPYVGSPTVDIILHYEGEGPIPYPIETVVNCVNVDITWDLSYLYYPPVTFNIYKDGDSIANVSEMFYTDSLVIPEETYQYGVSAVYTIGETWPNPINVSVPLPENLEPLNLDGEYFSNIIEVTLSWDEPDACLLPEGYNVYRNGDKINSELVIEPMYVDTDISWPGFIEYNVTAVYYFGESVYSNTFYVMYTNVEKKELDGIHIFPNPAQDKLYIRAVDPIDKVGLFDLQGALLMTLQSRQGEIQLDVADLNPGVYFLKLKFGSDEFLEKIVVK